MTELQETISNPLVQIESEYCRRLLREKSLSLIDPRRVLEETSISVSSPEAYNLAIAEEQVNTALCSNAVITSEEYGLMTSMSWKEIMQTLLKLQSSKEYSMARTSPIINKLSQVWVLGVIGFRRLIDINRIHRNLTFDITSSDPVDDFIRIKFPMENLEIPSKFLPQLSPEILQFCSRQRILGYVPTAINLLGRSFPSISELKIDLEKDPETGEEWLVLNVTIQGEVDEVLNNYDNYTIHWVSLVPWPERHKIRLSYNII
jgi:hypothetical protein